ncbi:DUF6479 family protein [Actinacidiphila yeochonensis]|uniref:DUF6479 family protein n=1 Tax=Actinacidiphila yeochonensis TaxID=89050 RepID=UPI00068E3F91|nr:DUF6479 family protein [Actinacidiphila yeochonensis]
MSVSAQQMTQLALPDGAIAPLVIGICIVLVLIGGVWIGMRRREPPVPPGEHPRSGAWQTRQEHETGAPPDHGPGHQGDGARSHDARLTEPDVMPTDGRRRFPHEVHDSGVHAGRVPSHPRRHSGPNVD